MIISILSKIKPTSPLVYYADGRGDDEVDASHYYHEGKTYFDLGQGNDKGYGTSRNENFVGGWGDDQIWGRGGSDKLYGDTSNDTLYGGDGYDFLDGGSQEDILYGELGKDTLYGGEGRDTLYGDYKDNTLGGDSDFLFGGMGNDNLFGGPGNDVLTGDAGNDRLLGDDNNDQLLGGTGDDFLTGGKGADTFIFYDDQGVDRIYDFNRSEGDKINLAYLNLVESMVHDKLPDVKGSAWGTVILTLQVFDKIMDYASPGKFGYGNTVEFDFGDETLIVNGQTLQTMQITDFVFW